MIFSFSLTRIVIFLGFKEALATLVSNENFTLNTANQLYLQTGFKLLTSYLENVQSNYLANAVNTDFAESEAAR
jgi:serine protease inhibitor